MDFIREHLPAQLIELYNLLPTINFQERRQELQLSAERAGLLQAIVRGHHDIDHLYTLLDIHLFCLKALHKHAYLQAQVQPHPAASGDLLTYDPPKNGQNLLKHGLTFPEVISYSPNFGVLQVPCPNAADGERLVVLSKLDIPKDVSPQLPTPVILERRDLCTLTIAVLEKDGYRFISSRTFHRDNWGKVLDGAVKEIFEDEPEKRETFLRACQEAVESDLFDATSSAPLRLIRAES